MNKQQIIAAVQSVISQNRDNISLQHEVVNLYKKLKRDADTQGNLEDEYAFHNQKQYERSRLLTFVRNQKALKTILKELQHN